MIEVYCRTNLDLRGEQWPEELPEVPRVGDRVQSRTKHGQFQLELEVCAVTWRYGEFQKRWYAEVELHMSSFHRGLRSKDPEVAQGSIKAFYEWYAPAIGSHVSAFI